MQYKRFSYNSIDRRVIAFRLHARNFLARHHIQLKRSRFPVVVSLIYLVVVSTFLLAVYIGFSGYPIALVIYGAIGICFSAFGWFKEIRNESWFLRRALYVTAEKAEHKTEDKTSNNERQCIVSKLFKEWNPKKGTQNTYNKSNDTKGGNCA